MSLDFSIIVTLGPSILNEKMIKEISTKGSCIFRINGSHVAVKDMPEIISFVRKHSQNSKIMIDLPGNKIRTSDSFMKINYQAGDKIILNSDSVNYSEFYDILEVDDILYTNDSLNSMKVTSIDKGAKEIICTAENDGDLVKNKGIHIRKTRLNLPFLFKKDKDIIEFANNSDVDIIAMSFVRNVNDVREAKSLVTKKDLTLIAKIEKQEAINNMDEIFKEIDHILVDRGDLSNDVGMKALPFCQDMIVKKALQNKLKVFLATQFLKSMEDHSIPYIAEVMGLYNDISEGVHGIQLSEETAIGAFPLECIDIVFSMYEEVTSRTNRKL